MTDAFEVQSAHAPAESLSTDSFQTIPAMEGASDVLDAGSTVAEEKGPNGFELLGLAPELIRAVADLGYTQPTTVQLLSLIHI